LILQLVITTTTFTLQVLEPIDEVKAKVQKNTDTISTLQNTIDQMKVELERATSQDDKILMAIKELKQDMNKKGPSLSSASSRAKKLFKSVIKKATK